MRDLNYLRKLVMETIEEDVRKSSRNRKRLSESSKKKLHKRKLAEGLRKAKLILENDGDETPPEIEAQEEAGPTGSVEGMDKTTDINSIKPEALAAAVYGGPGAQDLLDAMKVATKWATKAMAGKVESVDDLKALAEKTFPSQEELVTRIKKVNTDLGKSQGFDKLEMPAFEDNDFEAIKDALNANDGGKLAVDFEADYKDGLESFVDYKKRLETGEGPDGTQTRRKQQSGETEDSEAQNESVSRWSKLAGLPLLTEINNDPRFPFSGQQEVMPGASNRGDSKEVDYDHAKTTGDAKKFLEKGAGTGDETAVIEDSEADNSSLKPTQTNIKAAKSLLFALMNSGLDFEGAYADQDGHILDGHHRWSGQYLRTGGAAKHTNLHIINRPDGMDLKTFLTMLTVLGQALGRPTKS